MNESQVYQAVYHSCASPALAEFIAKNRGSFDSLDRLKKKAEEFFLSQGEEEWLKAFSAHPRIGDLEALRKKFAGDEQGQVAAASESVLLELKEKNDDYFQKYGFIFIVCATGKSAEEMLFILRSRLQNDRSQELKNAAREQVKIMHLRMDKLL